MEQEYTRKGHIITDMNGKVVFEGQTKLAAVVKDGKKISPARTIPSISKAKAKSRELQSKGLGRGQLKVAA